VTKKSTDPFDFIARLRAAAQGGYPIPTDVAQWLDAGIAEFELDGGRRPLCVCLGLRGAGVVSLETWRARQQRDAALLVAFNLIRGDELGDWQRGQAVAAIVTTFGRVWPRAPSPPGPAAAALFDAIQFAFEVATGAGLAVPQSVNGILARVRLARRDSQGGGDFTHGNPRGFCEQK